jgi:hypothetical protein
VDENDGAESAPGAVIDPSAIAPSFAGAPVTRFARADALDLTPFGKSELRKMKSHV